MGSTVQHVASLVRGDPNILRKMAKHMLLECRSRNEIFKLGAFLDSPTKLTPETIRLTVRLIGSVSYADDFRAAYESLYKRVQSALNSPINSEGNEAVFKEVERCIEQIYQDLMVLTSALSAHLKAVYAQSLLDGKMARSPWWGVFEPQDRFRIGVHSERGDVDAKTKPQMTMRRKPASQLGMR